MKYESIADIFSARQKIREGLEIVIGGISPDEAARIPDDGGWSIQQIVEHIAMVDGGAARICSKLLEASKADGKPSDGSFSLTEEFAQMSDTASSSRFQAPERVQPSGSKTVPESIAGLQASQAAIAAMQPDMESFDLGGHTFPHPFFGELTAAEWLVVAGGHELRHTLQIQQVLERVRT